MRTTFGIVLGSALALFVTSNLLVSNRATDRSLSRISLYSSRLVTASGTQAQPLIITDDAVWITQGIQDALTAGLPSYTVPAGTYNIQSPIIIPAGTQNFSLLGAGSGQTILTTPYGKLSHLITAGSLYNIYRNTSALKLSAGVKQGDASIVLPITTPIQIGKYYALQDDYTVSAGSLTTVVKPRFELVKFTSFSTISGRAALDKPSAREYNVNPVIYFADNYVSKNISISGFGMDGTIVGTTTDASDRLVYGVLIDNLALTDLKVQTFQSAGIEVDQCRNVHITNSIVNHSVDLGAGQGYGFILRHSRFVDVSNCSADGCRHGFILHSGTTDTTITSCVASGAYSNFDLHGFDERRVTFTNCTSGNSINIGNDKWLAGAKNVTIQSCSLGGPLVLCPNANVITVTNSSLGGVRTSYVNSPLSNPVSGFPNNVKFDTCTFSTDNNVFTNQPTTIGTISFNLCTFESTRTDFGTTFLISQFDKGSLIFSLCKFTVDSVRPGDVPFQITGGGLSAKINIKSCQFFSPAGALSAVSAIAPFAGSLTVTSNVFTTTGPVGTPTLLLNTSGVTPTNWGNSTVIK